MALSEEESCDIGCDEKGSNSLVKRIEKELELTDRVQVIRRHVALEVFDGVLPVLGIIMAGIVSLHFEPAFFAFEPILLASLGTSVAMFIAGFSASYLTEEAEGKIILEELEASRPKQYSHKVLVKAERESALVVSLVDGLTPAIAILVCISPLFLVFPGWLQPLYAFYASLCVGLVLLLLLGGFLGWMAKANILIYGLKTLAAGGLTLLITYIISTLTGAPPH